MRSMMQANHLPAFLSMVKMATRDGKYSIPYIIDQVELVMTNDRILPAIRFQGDWGGVLL